MEISICVPAYNEEETLEAVIEDLVLVLEKHFDAAEIIIVNDGSSDRTAEIADELAAKNPELIQVIHHPLNSGYGAGYRTGLECARFPWYALAPADGQFNPRDLIRMAGAAEEADLVLGSRVQRIDPLYRKLNTYIFRLVTKAMFGLPYHDVNWVKLGRTNKLRTLDLESDGIGVDTELVAKAHRKGWKIVEVKTQYLPRVSGEDFGRSPARVLATVAELWRLRPKLARAGNGTGGDPA